MKKNSILINLTDSFNYAPKYIITNKSKCYDSDGNETGCNGCPENAMDYYSDRNEDIQKATESNYPKPGSDFAKAKEELEKVCKEEGETDEDRAEYLAKVLEQAKGRYNDFVTRESGRIDAAGADQTEQWVDSQLLDATQYSNTQLPPFDWMGMVDPFGATPLGYDDELKMSPEDAMYTVGGFSAATLTAAQISASKAAEQQVLRYLNDKILKYNNSQNTYSQLPLLKDLAGIQEALGPNTFFRGRTTAELQILYGQGKEGSRYFNVKFFDFFSNETSNIARRNMEFLTVDVMKGSAIGSTKAAAEIALRAKLGMRTAAAANKQAETTLMNKKPKFFNTGVSKGCTTKERVKGALTNRIGWLAAAVTAAVAVFARNCQAAELEANKNLNEECSRKNQKIKAAKDKFDEEKKKIEDKQKKDVDDIKKDKPDLPPDCVPSGTQGADPDTGIWPQGNEPIDGGMWDNPSTDHTRDQREKAEAARRAKEKLAKELEPPCDIKEIDCAKYTIIDPMNHGACP